MDMVRVAEFPAGTDVTPVRRILESRGVPHRFSDDRQGVVLYIGEDVNPADVIDLLKAAARDAEREQEQLGIKASASLATQFGRTPAMFVLLILSVVGAMIPRWFPELLPWLTFQDFVQVSETRVVFSESSEALSKGQYWRLITPIFIHFGIFHIVFNGLWLWELGRRIETVAGSMHFLLLALVAGVISNLSEYIWSGPSVFGGMSGVVFALLGYIWIRNRLSPHPGLVLPAGVVPVMIGWLLFCMTGVIQFFLQAGIANAAHLSGLLTGMALGAVFGVFNRSQSGSN